MLGALIGGFLPRLARWAGELPWVPFQDPLNALASLTGWWVPVAGALLGVTAGIWLAYVAFKESLAVTVDGQNVRLAKDGDRQTVARADVAAVFLDGKQLVMVGTSGEELVREAHEATDRRIADAFTAHGYPWTPDGDPTATPSDAGCPTPPTCPLPSTPCCCLLYTSPSPRDRS